MSNESDIPATETPAEEPAVPTSRGTRQATTPAEEPAAAPPEEPTAAPSDPPAELAPGQQVEKVAERIGEFADNELQLLNEFVQKEILRRSQA